jgi:hypothetical protein
MGEVYHCVDPRGIEVAVKWLHATKASSRERFVKEMAAMAKVQHPRLLRLLDSGDHENRPYAVLEYVEGQELRVYGRKLRLRPAQERIREVRRIGMALCDALAELHRHGLVHRDVKPSNVLLTRTGDVRLADLGVIRDLHDPSTAVVGRLIGTAAYAPPEQSRGEEVDHRADLYALGCTLFSVLTSRRPYPHRERKDVIRAHRYAEVPRARSLDPAVPEKMDKVLARLMAKDPRDRYDNARAAKAALAQSSPSGAPAPLAGRRIYVDQVAAALDQQPGSLVLRPQGPRGSGRGWLLEVIEELASARGRAVVIARDKRTLSSALKRMTLESLVVGTYLRVPPKVPARDIELVPLGLAAVRRTVVSVATRTPEPHAVAERLHRATGGHPAWLLPLLDRVKQGALVLPEALPVPGELEEVVSELDPDSLQVLAALSVMMSPCSAKVVEQVAGVPAELDLVLLQREGLVLEEAGTWRPMGTLVAQCAIAYQPDVEQLEDRAKDARAPGPAHVEDPVDHARTLLLRGLLQQLDEQTAPLLVQVRAAQDGPGELELLLLAGRGRLDAGEPRAALRLLSDASALAHALDEPLMRRASHVMRAEATMAAGGHAAPSAALDRLHRALSKVKVAEDPGWRSLALALRARLAAQRGDSRSYQRALDAIQPAEDDTLRLRTGLHLAWAALESGDAAAALVQADAVGAEAATRGWMTLADQASAAGMQAR